MKFSKFCLQDPDALRIFLQGTCRGYSVDISRETANKKEKEKEKEKRIGRNLQKVNSGYTLKIKV